MKRFFEKRSGKIVGVIAVAAIAAFVYMYSAGQPNDSRVAGTVHTVPIEEGEKPVSSLLSVSDRSESVLSIRSESQNVGLRVDVVNTAASQEQGLSGRDGLDNGKGMFFAFQDSGSHPLWMKDMKFPLDMIWIDRSGYIVHIEKDVRPESFPKAFSSPVDAQFIVEVSAGFSEFFGLKAGDLVTVK